MEGFLLSQSWLGHKEHRNVRLQLNKTAPFVPELKEFEDGLTSIIEKIKFRKVYNTFQQKLRKDITKIKNDNHLLIPADKTNNYYKFNSEQYETLLNKSIQKEYKKSTETAESHITREDKNIAERLKLSDRINITAKREAFLTLKDHKPNFRTNQAAD